MKYNLEDIKTMLKKSNYKYEEYDWFFPSDLSPFNNKFKYACKKLAEEGLLERGGDAHNKWGYYYRINQKPKEELNQ